MDIMPMPQEPASPADVQSGPVGDPNAPISSDHKAQLQQMLALVKQGLGKWNTVKFSMQNRSESAKRDELKRVFQLLMTMGVDLQDPKSVAQFLAQVKQQDPEKAKILESAIDYLLGGNYESSNPTQPTQGPGPLPQGTPEATLPSEAIQGVS